VERVVLVKPRHPALSTTLFFTVQVAAVVGVIATGWSWSGFALAVGLYYLRMFFITAGYHRYFSHRAFKTSRAFQFVLAFMAETSAQKGVLWWAATHRHHHKHSDTPQDVHSPRMQGFWWSHVGWAVSAKNKVFDARRVPDLTVFPELVWINRRWVVPPLVLAGLCYAFGGLHGLLWGFGVSTLMTWHGTFTINSLAHVIGRRRFETSDDSRNHFGLALLTMGEGWHNNHHHYQSSARQGFRWYEIDLTYYLLRALAAVGLIWDLREPPARLLRDQPEENLATRRGPNPNPALREVEAADPIQDAA
jgi:stearoyl-CoA desaturase (Delta-9 desaturase)